MSCHFDETIVLKLFCFVSYNLKAKMFNCLYYVIRHMVLMFSCLSVTEAMTVGVIYFTLRLEKLYIMLQQWV